MFGVWSLRLFGVYCLAFIVWRLNFETNNPKHQTPNKKN